jgi:hypothetical protein
MPALPCRAFARLEYPGSLHKSKRTPENFDHMERIPLGRRRELAAKLLSKGERPTDISRKIG